MPPNIQEDQRVYASDHDLLLIFKGEVTTKLDRVISDVKELKDNVAARVTDLENEKANKKDVELTRQDYETRLRFLERYVWGALAVISTAIVVIGWYVIIHKQ